MGGHWVQGGVMGGVLGVTRRVLVHLGMPRGLGEGGGAVVFPQHRVCLPPPSVPSCPPPGCRHCWAAGGRRSSLSWCSCGCRMKTSGC